MYFPSFACRTWKHQTSKMPPSATMTAKELPESTPRRLQEMRR